MYGLDLFSGIGGITKGLSKWVMPIAYCEIDPYAQGVLLSRMADGNIPRAPIWDDIKTLHGSNLPKGIDIIYGGFPCQDISVAGLKKGLEGERSGLFFEICRLVKEIQPSFVFLENVPNIRSKGLFAVVQTFTEMGYDCRWTCIAASSLGAPHRRERWFLLAHTNSNELRQQQGRSGGEIGQRTTQPNNNGQEEFVADSDSLWQSQREGSKQDERGRLGDGCEHNNSWETEPNVGRVADGIPFRMDRLKALGNAVVPQQVEEVLKKLIGI